MECKKLLDDLHVFMTPVATMPLTFNQYLLDGNAPILFHTGSMQMTKELVPQIKQILGEKELAYVFVSHFESDECGGLEYLRECFPGIKVICSAVTGRQLSGFGHDYGFIVKAPGDTLSINGQDFQFFAYPSEMHLWEGILVMEMTKGLFFSSDLIIKKETAAVNWQAEVNGLDARKVPSEQGLAALKDALKGLDVKYIATGHGSFLQCE